MDIDGFLGRIQVARWVAMVCMAKKWLRSRSGVLARVMCIFGGECGMHQTVVLSTSACAGVYTIILNTIVHVSLTSVYIFGNTLSAGCARALVHAYFADCRWGKKVGGFSYSMQGTCYWRGMLSFT